MSTTAVILAGGRGSRLGGADKAALELEGTTLLDRLLDRLPSHWPVVVVGPRRSVSRAVDWVTEDRPFGGPVSALDAAMPLVDTELLALIAVDMPDAADVLPALESAACLAGDGTDGAVSVDSQGRRQQLCCVMDASATRSALAGVGDTHGAAMRDLQELLQLVEVPCADDGLLRDIDTPEDLLGWST